MTSVKKTILDFASKVEYKTKDIFYGYVFPVFVAFVALFSYLLNLSFIGFAIIVFLICFLLVFYKEQTPFLPLMTMWLFSFSGNSVFTGGLFTLLAIAIPVVFSFVFRLIIYSEKFTFGNLFLPLCLVSVALFCGGLFSLELGDYYNGLLTIFQTGPLLLFVYAFFRNNVKPNKNVHLPTYYSFVMTISGIVVSIQCILSSLKTSNPFYHDIGWGNINGAATFLLVSIFFSMYLAIKTKYFLLCLVAFAFQLIGIIATASDGVFGTVCVLSPICFLLLFLYADRKKRQQLFSLLIIILLITTILTIIHIETNCFGELIKKYTEGIHQDNGRTKYYIKAVELFTKNPIFGVGLGYYDANFLDYFYGFFKYFWFHSTLFQVMACMGIFGVVVYIYYFYSRYKIITLNNNAFSMVVFMAFSAFTVYGMIDCAEFSAAPQMLTATIMLVITEIINLNEKGKVTTLPLSLNKF